MKIILQRVTSRSLILASLITAVLSSAAAGATPPLRQLEAAEASADLALLKRALLRVHPGYDRFATSEELEGQWEALHRLAETGPSDGDLYLGISRLLASLRCSHTKAEVPTSISGWREQNPTYLPFRLEIFGDRAFLAVIDESQPGLEVGQELLAIDGMPVAELLDAVRPLLSIDGFTEASREPLLGFATEYQGAGIDHFGALLHGFRSSFTLRLEPAQRGQAVLELEVKSLTYPAWQAMATGGEDRYVDFKDQVSWRLLQPGIALLEVGTFVNYRKPVDPDEVFGTIFRELAERSVRALILDLRNNGGGSDDAQLSLLRHLIREPRMRALPALYRANGLGDLAEVLTTWDEAALRAKPEWFDPAGDGYYTLKPEISGTAAGPISPSPDAFEGRIVVLTSPSNSSGSTHLIAQLVDSGRVRTAGLPTGGNPTGATAGLLFTLELPASKIRVLIPAVRTRLAVQSFQDGMPIEPDLLVERSPETFFSGEDETLLRALEELRNSSSLD